MEILDKANIIRQKRKTLKLVINNNGSLTIFCPLKIALEDVKTLLKPKENLITKRISYIKQHIQENEDFYSFKKILVLGKEYRVLPSKSFKKPFFTASEVLIPEKFFLTNCLDIILKRTLRELSSKIIKSRVEDIILRSEKNIYYKDLLIGNFKSKWGSCDNYKIIKLNWKLVMLPTDLLDFVICHEMTHLQELNHSKNFYLKLENFYPNSSLARKQLKKYDFLLNIY